MSKVFADMGISLDGYVAGANAGTANPLGDRGTRIHQWVYTLKSWRGAIGLDGGETNDDDALVRARLDRTGAHVMGRRMFDEGEANWPENAPFHKPVFVVSTTSCCTSRPCCSAAGRGCSTDSPGHRRRCGSGARSPRRS